MPENSKMYDGEEILLIVVFLREQTGFQATVFIGYSRSF